MNPVLDIMRAASSAEEIFGHFDVPFDPTVMNVSRLHILKRLQSYLARDGWLRGLDTAAARERVRRLLRCAHDDFIGASAPERKVFRVSHRGQVIPVEAIGRSRRRT